MISILIKSSFSNDSSILKQVQNQYFLYAVNLIIGLGIGYNSRTLYIKLTFSSQTLVNIADNMMLFYKIDYTNIYHTFGILVKFNEFSNDHQG